MAYWPDVILYAEGWLLVSIVVQALFNVQRSGRFMQYLFPVFALLYIMAAGVVACLFDSLELQYFFQQVARFIDDLLAGLLDFNALVTPLVDSNAVVFANLGLLTVFVLVKTIAVIVIAAAVACQRATYWAHQYLSVRQGLIGSGVRALGNRLSRSRAGDDDEKEPSLWRYYRYFYEYALGQGAVLRPGSVPVRRLMLVMWTGAIFVFLAFPFLPLLQTPYPWISGVMPLLPMAWLLLFGECAFALGGRIRVTGDTVQGDDVKRRRAGSFRDLWLEYRETWQSRLLASAELPSIDFQKKGDEVVFIDNPEVRALWEILKVRVPACRQDARNTLEELSKEETDSLLIVRDFSSLAPPLFIYLEKYLAEGERILVIVHRSAKNHIAAFLSEQLKQFGSPYWNIGSPSSSRPAAQFDIVVVSLSDVFTDPGMLNSRWSQKVGIVLVPDWGLVANGFSQLAALTQIIRDRLDRVRFIVMGHDVTGWEPAVSSGVSGQVVEHDVLANPSKPSLSVCVFRAEDETPMQAAVGLANYPSSMGCEPVLSLMALRDKVKHICVVHEGDIPWDDYLESIDGARRSVSPKKFSDLESLPALTGRVAEAYLPWLVETHDRSTIIVRDTQGNLPMAISSVKAANRDETLLLIVSPPYLLRDWFADRLEAFISNPIEPIAPQAGGSKQILAMRLAKRMLMGNVTIEAIDRELRGVKLGDYSETVLAVRSLFKDVFDIDVIKHNYLRANNAIDEDPYLHRRVRQTVLSLSGDIVRNPRFEDWPNFVSVTTRSGDELAIVDKPLARQFYLKDQIHIFQGKRYRIEGYDEKRRCLDVVLVTKEAGLYRDVIDIVWRSETSIYPIKIRKHRWEIESCVSEAIFDVTTHGYFSFCDRLTFQPGCVEYVDLYDKVTRSHQFGPMINLRITPAPGLYSSSQLATIGRTLSLMLNELFPTLFPQAHELFWATSLVDRSVEEETRAEGEQEKLRREQTAEGLLPRLFVKDGVKVYPNSLHLLIFEDSDIDIGFVNALRDEGNHLLDILFGYLSWTLMPEQETYDHGAWESHVAAEDRQVFLRFGGEMVPDFLDLELTHEFLKAFFAGLPGSYEFSSYILGDEVIVAQKGNSGLYCHSCWTRISTADYTELSDGRLQCHDCAEASVCSLANARNIYADVRMSMERDFGISFREGVDIGFVDAGKLAAAVGKNKLITSSLDNRTIGVAIKTRNDKIKVLVENGQPYWQFFTTLAHEMTHVWQFDHLDMDLLEDEERFKILEGHAMYVEWYFLGKVALGNNADELVREGAGVGYVASLEHTQQLLTQVPDKNPFTFFKNKFGSQ